MRQQDNYRYKSLSSQCTSEVVPFNMVETFTQAIPISETQFCKNRVEFT